MTIDLKTASVTPLRRTFDHLAAKLGPDKQPSRYQEAVWGLQPELNFHYRPTWDPTRALYDPGRTAIVMRDFDDLVDPRQYYYGTWTIQRGRQQDAQERNFEFVEKRRLLATLAPEWRERIAQVVVPLRHVAWAANTNSSYIAAYGFGAPLTSAASMQMMDQLGIAQYLSRIGLLLADNETTVLDAAKAAWLTAPQWQPLRALVEESMVTRDWFELFLLQQFLVDGGLHPLVFEHFDAELVAQGGAVFAMLTAFIVEWFAESSRWVDAVLGIAAAEAPANRDRLCEWLARWQPRVRDALLPVALAAFGTRGEAVLDAVHAKLDARAAALGLVAAGG
jgi:phenol/toluene 2-monooxygenase (NADH) P1/A1